MRTLQKEHREQAQCNDSRERKECTYMSVCVCVCVRGRARLQSLRPVVWAAFSSTNWSVCSVHMCVRVCQWMCKSWSLCCSMQTLVRVRVEYQCGVVHKSTKAQKQQSSKAVVSSSA